MSIDSDCTVEWKGLEGNIVFYTSSKTEEDRSNDEAGSRNVSAGSIVYIQMGWMKKS